MEQSGGRERDLNVDLESGGNTSEEEGYIDSNSGVKQTKKFLCRVWTGFLSVDGSVKGQEGVNVCSDLPHSVDVSTETAELLGERKLVGEQEKAGCVEKKSGGEKPRKASKKPPKPPRPPRSPMLDPVDQKLAQEISKLAMLKQARLERIKSLKKMKALKAASSSSSNSLCAMIITVLFILIMILQVM